MESHLDRVIPNQERIRLIFTIDKKDQVRNKVEREEI